VLGVGKVAAETVSTVHRARAGHNHQRPTAVLLEETVSPRSFELGQGIGRVARCHLPLEVQWQHLPKQWIARVTATHPIHIAAWYPEPEAVRSQARFGDVADARGIEIETAQQLVEIGHRCGEV
jgi:hypothetical protein